MIDNSLKDLYLKLSDKKFIVNWERLHSKKYPEIFLLNGLPFHFDTNSKKIAVTLSGGADSAILTIMLCELIKSLGLKTKIHVITTVRFWNSKPWLARDAEKLYDHLKELYPEIIEQQHWGFIPPELEIVKISDLNNPKLSNEFPLHATLDTYISGDFEEYVSIKNDIEWCYSGVTMNPPLDLPDAPKFRDIEFTENEIGRIISNIFISPFALVQKNFTLAQYKNYNVEYLLPMTRSCEADYSILGEEYKNNKKTPPVCNTCFFCEERKWGFDNAYPFYKENL